MNMIQAPESSVKQRWATTNVPKQPALHRFKQAIKHVLPYKPLQLLQVVEEETVRSNHHGLDSAIHRLI
jgi:hypothetical protein